MNPILEAAEKVEEDVVQLEKFRSSVFWRETVMYKWRLSPMLKRRQF